MNKKKLYNSIMESVSKELQNILLFDNSNIFNKEEIQYDNSNMFDNYIYKNILEKLKNAEYVSKEEYEYVYQFKYKVKSYDELREIIKTYSEKNPTGSLNWIDTSLITDMSNLFESTKYNGDISEWDVSNVKNMGGMFSCAESFNQPIGNWDVSNVTDMSFMFYLAKSFNQPIGKWNTINVTNMKEMFYDAKNFNQPIGDWNVSNVINMKSMFRDAIKFNQDISKWKLNPKVNIDKMYLNCNIDNNFKAKISKKK